MNSTPESAIPTVKRLSPQDARAALRAHAHRLRDALEKATPGPWEVLRQSSHDESQCCAFVEPVSATESDSYRLFDSLNRGYKASLIERLGDDGKWDDVNGYNDLDLAVKAANSARAAALAFETLADAPCFLILGDNCASCKNAVRVAEALAQ